MKHSAKAAGLAAAIGAFLFLSLSLVQCLSQPEKNSEPETALVDETEEEIQFDLPPVDAALPVSSFGEIWAYVVAGREAALTRGLPISDIGYFGAELNAYGKLINVPARSNLSSFTGRVHLVVACNGYPLTHFALMPGSKERKALIEDLLTETKNFDGLQIDFEYVPAKDGEAYISFMRELRAGLPPGKMFTVANKARSRKIADDVYDYEKVKPIVDRILVMAYDEHWAGSAPGSIASLAFCSRVAEYSLRVIGKEKLIMGLPFYGRAWGDHNPSRALIYSTIESLIKERNITDIRRENGIPVFDYVVPVSVKLYYEDVYSLSVRMEMYKSMGVGAIGFWRLGQETPQVWRVLKLEK
ncbi:MAG: glycoside hydrolase [Treponema sp.]|jgi:spore germination protein YaaH|nr:glycoside hydrolase [Treponema sp.]